MTNIQVSNTIVVKIKDSDFVLTQSEALALYNALGKVLNMRDIISVPPYQPYNPNDIWYRIPPVTCISENTNQKY